MKTSKELARKMIASLVNDMVAHEKRVWPPYCVSFAFQPVRPVKENAGTDDKVERKL